MKSSTKSVITPKWNKPFIVTTEKFTIFEVPLGGDVKKYASTQYLQNGSALRSEVKKVTTKLILKRNNETREYTYFIATMVGRNEDMSVTEINYTHNRSFTGYIFISDLDGVCVGIYNCNSGVRRKAEFAKSKTKSAPSGEVIDGAVVQMFATPAAAYSFGESGGGSDGGGVTNTCYRCGMPNTGGLCLYCNPVIVTPDQCSKCHGPYDNCYCCWTCHQYPCQCRPAYNCSYCGSYYCNGECQFKCPYCGNKYCYGNCRSSGGGNPSPDPEKPCDDVKCPTCGKCLDPTEPNCLKCDCKEHLHEECPWCHKCYKDDNDVCKTRSTSHTDSCPICECCPDCMGVCKDPWTGVGHANIIKEAFPGFTSVQIGYLNEGSRYADTQQETKDSYMHGMRARGQSKEAALLAMRGHFIKNVDKFYNKLSTEKEKFFALGQAVHMISDCYSPAHSNKTWIKNIFNFVKHVRDFRIFSNRSFNQAKQGTIIVVNQIKDQFNSGNHDAGAIFDQWRGTMPAYSI